MIPKLYEYNFLRRRAHLAPDTIYEPDLNLLSAYTNLSKPQSLGDVYPHSPPHPFISFFIKPMRPKKKLRLDGRPINEIERAHAPDNDMEEEEMDDVEDTSNNESEFSDAEKEDEDIEVDEDPPNENSESECSEYRDSEDMDSTDEEVVEVPAYQVRLAAKAGDPKFNTGKPDITTEQREVLRQNFEEARAAVEAGADQIAQENVSAQAFAREYYKEEYPYDHPAPAVTDPKLYSDAEEADFQRQIANELVHPVYPAEGYEIWYEDVYLHPDIRYYASPDKLLAAKVPVIEDNNSLAILDLHSQTCARMLYGQLYKPLRSRGHMQGCVIHGAKDGELIVHRLSSRRPPGKYWVGDSESQDVPLVLVDPADE